MARVFDAPIISNDQSLDRLLAAQIPVLILLWRDGQLSDRLDHEMIRLASQEAGNLIVAKINVQENPEAARRFDAQQTLLLVGIQQGEEVSRLKKPSAKDMEEHAEFLLGRAARPKVKSTSKSNGGGNGSNQRVNINGEKRPVHVTDATFEEKVLQSPIPVLVDFWAPWCGPCHMIAPTLEKLAREYAGKVRITKVNVDENPYYAGTFGVQGIPTLLLIKNGKVIDRLVGAMPENYLKGKIEQQLIQ